MPYRIDFLVWVGACALMCATACSSEITRAESDFDVANGPSSGGGAGSSDGGSPSDELGDGNGFDLVACESAPLPVDQARRLNVTELNTIVDDVLGDSSAPFSAIGNDYGIRIGTSLGTSERFLTDYLEVAEQIAGSYVERIDPESACDQPDRACAKATLAAVAAKLFRRPVSDARLEGFASFADVALDSGLSFDEGVAAGLTAILMSPDFFTVGTNVESEPGVYVHDGHGVAENLALALWNSVPDDALLAAVSDGSLDTPEGIETQVRRMLEDTKGARFLRGFIDRHFDFPSANAVPLGLEDVEGNREALAGDLRREAELLIEHVFANNLPVETLVNGTTTFINERLANYYGYDGVSGDEFVEFSTAGTSRTSGLLTMGATLAQEVDLIHRGVNVLQTYLCEALVAPDPEVIEAALDDIPDDATVRDEVDYRISNSACAACHVLIDPLGAAFERFDAGGFERSTYDNGDSTDYSLEFQDTTIAGPSDVANAVLDDRFLPCMASQVLGWVGARNISLYEESGRCASQRLVVDTGSGVGMRDLVVQAFTSEVFRSRVVE